jgi:hypothetical protein
MVANERIIRRKIARFEKTYPKPSLISPRTVDEGLRVGVSIGGSKPVKRTDPAYIPAMIKKTDSMPRTAIKPPATAGANIVVKLMPMAFRATAFINLSLSTSCGIMAWRAGIINGITLPCTKDTTRKCTHVIVSVEIDKAMNRATIKDTAWPACMILFLSNRSAITPPKRANIRAGTALAAVTTPSKDAESVNS